MAAAAADHAGMYMHIQQQQQQQQQHRVVFVTLPHLLPACPAPTH
jgi:hypothetical protein